MTSTGRRVAAGAAWTYGAQVASVVLQFSYAAVTSRVVSPTGFGHYAIAISVVGLVSLLANGGLGQAVARMTQLEPTRLGAIASYSVLLGVAAAGLTALTAPFWAWLWGAPAALPVVQVLAVAGIASPYQGFVTGLLRRVGSFRTLALATLAGNLLGMVVGVVAVLLFRSAASLTVSAIAASIFTVLICVLSVDRSLLRFTNPMRARADLAYSNRVTFSNVLSYLTGNILKIGMTRFVGAASLGYWNRTEVITTLPFQQLQNAVIQTVYPEFRHDVDSPQRARSVWTDLLIAVAWVALCGGAAAAVVLPVVVPLLFGPRWGTTADLVPVLAVVGAIQLVSVLLSSAIEAIGRFRWIWWTEAILITMQIAGCAVMAVQHSIWVAAWTLVATNIVRHVYQVAVCSRAGYVDGLRLARNEAAVVVGAVATAGICALWIQGFRLVSDAPTGWWLVAAASVLTVVAVVAVARWHPAVRMVRRYAGARRA